MVCNSNGFQQTPVLSNKWKYYFVRIYKKAIEWSFWRKWWDSNALKYWLFHVQLFGLQLDISTNENWLAFCNFGI